MSRSLNLRCGQSPSGPRRKGYGHVKRQVLRWRLKLSNDGEYLTGRGISFHIWGEAEESSTTQLGFSSRNFKKKLTRGTEDTARMVI